MPAANAGKDAKDAGWVAWKNVPETGTVPEMLAVTLPICAVPATNAGSVVSETACVAGKLEMLAVTEPIWAVPATNAGRVVRDTGCVPWKNVPLTGTVPLMLAVTLPICAVPADNAGSELIVRLFPTVTVPPTVIALARSCTSVRPPVTVTCPMVTVMLSSALSDVGPSSTVPVTVLLVA